MKPSSNKTTQEDNNKVYYKRAEFNSAENLVFGSKESELKSKLRDGIDEIVKDDCKLWEEMRKKMFRAHELVAYPKRSQGLFYPQDSEIAYLNRHVFPVLLPGLCKTLQLAKLTNSTQFHWRAFNGIDFIAEYLWNNNPKHPFRTQRPLSKIPFVKRHLKKFPRKPYTKSSFFTEDDAATVIQAVVKGFLVRCRPEVQEMRNFWKALKQDKMKEKTEKHINVSESISITEEIIDSVESVL